MCSEAPLFSFLKKKKLIEPQKHGAIVKEEAHGLKQEQSAGNKNRLWLFFFFSFYFGESDNDQSIQWLQPACSGSRKQERAVWATKAWTTEQKQPWYQQEE